MTKECLYCGKIFVADKRNYGKQLYCSKRCGHQGWRKLNPEKDRAQAMRDIESRNNNPERLRKHKEKVSIFNKSPKRKFGHYQHNAKNRGFSFELTFEQFMTFWQKPCHYCGNNIETVGIDRVDNTIGYTLQNSVSCCKICNDMKKVLSVNEFITQCKRIVNNLEQIG